MKNLKLFILSIAVVTSIGTYETFGYEEYVDFPDQDTTGSDIDIDISGIDLSNVNTCKKKLKINEKLFSVTTEDMLKYNVLRFFYNNEPSESDQDTIFDELCRDWEIARKNNDNNMNEIFFEIGNYIIKQSGLFNERASIGTEKLNSLGQSFYRPAQRTLLIDGRESKVSASIVNKYPVLEEFTDENNTFTGEYNFTQCKSMTLELQDSIEKFEENGTYSEADKVKELFLEVRSAIESAIRKLSPDNANQAHEMNKYIRDVLSTEVIEKISSAYNKVLQKYQ